MTFFTNSCHLQWITKLFEELSWTT